VIRKRSVILGAMPDPRKASAPRLDPVVVAALNELREFTYRRRQFWEMTRGVKREKSLHDPVRGQAPFTFSNT
jgi:hypothetical protein